MTSAENKENPKINMVLEEFMSVNFKMRQVRLSPSKIFKNQMTSYIALFFLTCKLETPAALMTPNITINIPPITGSGIVVKTAPILPKTPIKTIKTPLVKITILLPTCQITNRRFALKIALL